MVAPHAGAWIETYVWEDGESTGEQSPLTQGRGLKRLLSCAYRV